MQIAPRSKEQWFDLVLVPAKVCLVVFIVVIRLRLRFESPTPFADAVLSACLLLSGPVLLLAALFQSIFCRSGTALGTLLFIGLAYSIFWWGMGGILLAVAGWLMWRFIRHVQYDRPISEEPIECIECHAVIPVGESRCSHCGWTFKA